MYKSKALRAIKWLKMYVYKLNVVRAIEGIKKCNVYKSNALRAIKVLTKCIYV